VRVSVKDDVVSNLGDIKGPVHLGLVVSRHRATGPGACQAKETMKKIARIKRLASSTPNHGSASESELQKRRELNVDLLPIDERIRYIRMSVEASKELVD